ncbi:MULTISPECIES: type II secretion system protein J [unclassified Marinobacterium]|uniref:PulJ/GspJ family protein n=1 Tax=unclassified Marinobacterium TaxID=2644139 RepID=UPI001569795D|nr:MULTISPECIES: prepilin-type N-terminal cleavage/methylation domain-containing protein [unclassified Marinobacterium]NRP09312.1 hypothetical protein [Marinobacterium sp. xm-g-48]NRP82157.1 hypothetical protein [Marinobacterium sp. xm-d-509]
MNKYLVKQKGYTLIELMIGMAVGLIVLSGALFLYLQIFNVSKTTLASTQLNRELSILIDTMSGEIRRHGYSALGSNSYYQTNSSSLEVNMSGDCILYGYDVNSNDNEVSDVSSDQKGFRLDSGVIHTKADESANCDPVFDKTHWTAITDESVMDISDLTIALNTVSTANGSVTVYSRSVDLSITASHATESLSSTKSVSVLIPNNYVED